MRTRGLIDDLTRDPLAASSRERKKYLRLLTRIQSAVPIEVIETVIANHMYPWTRVIHPDRLLDNALTRQDRSQAELDPFWAATWRAAMGLDRYLSELRLENIPVLELGCGSGRAGIAAALQGARVMMTDASSEALLVARFNAWPVRNRIEVRRLHWEKEQITHQRYPIIIGSDIVYDPSLWPMLEPCLRRHLDEDGFVLLSEPQRHTGDRFEEWIGRAGWKLRTKLIDLGDDQISIRVFRLTRNAAP